MMSSPSKRILPSVVFRIPETVSKRVVFPAPLGPKRETVSPFLTSKEISFNAGRGPYWTVSFFILSIGFYVYPSLAIGIVHKMIPKLFFVTQIQIRSTKSESRNNLKGSNFKFLKIRICFEFRYSGFGFYQLPPVCLLLSCVRYASTTRGFFLTASGVPSATSSPL